MFKSLSPIEIALIKKISGNAGGGGGGGSSSARPKDVNFYDYDGTLVASYSLSEAQSLTALPDAPTHSGLTFQGWNYTLEKVKAFTHPMNVGAMYITDDGKTRLYIRIAAEGRMSVPLHITQTVANGVTIDWGDGSAIQTLARTGKVNATHTYANIGDYVITLDPVDGCTLELGAGTSTYSVLGGSSNTSKVYNNMLQGVQVGIGVITISSSAFYYCRSLTSITIPNSVTSIGNSAFQHCSSLTSITIPDSVTSIASGAFDSCYSLTSVTIPNSLTRIDGSVFNSCSSLTSVTIPDGVTSIGSSAFLQCSSLTSVTIPNSLTSISGYAFQSCECLANITIPDGVTSIGSSAFQSCYALTSVTIPDSVTSIGDYAFQTCECLANITIPDGVTSIDSAAFQRCYGVAEYHLKPTTPPTLSNSDAFSNIPSDCVIYVPVGCLEVYQNATNWTTYASKMQEEPT